MASTGWLVFVAIGMAGFFLFTSLLFVNHFMIEEDKNGAWFPKFTAVAALWLSFASMMIMPYDVANTQAGTDSLVDMATLWSILYISLASLLGFFIPFAYFYYESILDQNRDKKKCSCDTQICLGLKYAFGFSICFIVIFCILFAVTSVADIPVHRVAYSSSLVVRAQHDFPAPTADVEWTMIADACMGTGDTQGCVESDFVWEIPLTFTVFVIGILCFLGWWFFMVFAGVGLVAMPLDMINKYRMRPRPVSRGVLMDRKMALGARATELRTIGEKLVDMSEDTVFTSSKDAIKHRQRLAHFEKAYHLLKKDQEILDKLANIINSNPLVPYMHLFFGILGALVGLLWVVHIAVFVLPDPPFHDFLNEFFITLTIPGFPFFGIICYAVFSYFLLWAVIVGTYRVGLRCFLCNMYPMTAHDTPMNSLLANIWVIALTSVPAVQFTVQCFPVYGRETEADMLFGTQIQYIKGLSIFWEYNIFVYVMVGLSFITLIYLTLFPKKDEEAVQAELKVMKMFLERDEQAAS